jgi:hypothetical protein
MNAIRRGAAAVLIAAALTATPATANADITRTQAELRQGTNPNHVLPSTEAEAWELRLEPAEGHRIARTQ